MLIIKKGGFYRRFLDTGDKMDFCLPTLQQVSGQVGQTFKNPQCPKTPMSKILNVQSPNVYQDKQRRQSRRRSLRKTTTKSRQKTNPEMDEEYKYPRKKAKKSKTRGAARVKVGASMRMAAAAAASAATAQI